MSSKTFKSDIFLYNIEDGQSGRSIKETRIFYQWSASNSIPPAFEGSSLEGASLILKEDSVLDISEEGASFILDANSNLCIFYEDTLYNFTTEQGLLKSGTSSESTGWVENSPPQRPIGQWYLWTLVVFIYSDETSSYSLSVSGENGLNGKDGQDGTTFYTWIAYADDANGSNFSPSPFRQDGSPYNYLGIAHNQNTQEPENWNNIDPLIFTWSLIKGADGQSGNEYMIESSQEEVVKFIEQGSNFSKTHVFSPEIIYFKVYKNSEILSVGEEFEYSLVHINNGIEQEISSLYFEVNTNSQQVGFKIQQYYNSLQDSSILEASSSTYVFKVYIESKQVAIKPFICRYGTSSDMATFNIHVKGFNAAIADTELDFNVTGLALKNGSFKIVDDDNKAVLEADEEGNLCLTGIINASAGGKIGGFNIESNRLSSTQKDADNNPMIELWGSTGKIVARDIELGTGAIIKHFMKFPWTENSEQAAYIYNPSINANGEEKLWLKAENISVYADGRMKLGTIEFNGGTGNLDAFIQSSNGNWIISESGRADFRDVYADNCHFKNTILEINSIQSAGNLTIFSDSWIIEEVSNDGKQITLDQEPLLGVEEYVYINQRYYKVVQVEGQRVTLDNGGQFTRGDIVTRIGEKNGLIFSIFGQSNAGLTDKTYTFAHGNCLTLARLEGVADGIGTFTPGLVLGNLDSMRKDGVSGIGLYADNVFLEGSLTTSAITNGERTYAGINTLSEAEANVFGNSDKSKIIFWAGAEKNTAEAIQRAPFQVTEQGSIYAQKGIFRDSIISDSVIQGADIYAARIHGGTQEDSAALTIYDSEIGIMFKNNFEGFDADGKVKDGNDELLINTKKMSKNNYTFIDFSENGLQFIGTSFNAQNIESSIVIDGDSISMYEKTGENTSKKEEIKFIKTNGNEKEYLFDFTINSEAVAQFKQDGIDLQTEQVTMNKNVQFGQNVYLQYRQVEQGYDLYVRSDSSQEVSV